MSRLGRMLNVAALALSMYLGMVLRPYLAPETKVAADSGRFDYVQIISAGFLYNGEQGALLLDKRNANLWFLGKTTNGVKSSFKDPVFVVHVPLEKLDEAVR